MCLLLRERGFYPILLCKTLKRVLWSTRRWHWEFFNSFFSLFYNSFKEFPRLFFKDWRAKQIKARIIIQNIKIRKHTLKAPIKKRGRTSRLIAQFLFWCPNTRVIFFTWRRYSLYSPVALNFFDGWLFLTGYYYSKEGGRKKMSIK